MILSSLDRKNTLRSRCIFPKAMSEYISPNQITPFASLHKGKVHCLHELGFPGLGGLPKGYDDLQVWQVGCYRGGLFPGCPLWYLPLIVHLPCAPHICELVHSSQTAVPTSQARKTVHASRKWELNSKLGLVKALNSLFSLWRKPLFAGNSQKENILSFSRQTGSSMAASCFPKGWVCLGSMTDEDLGDGRLCWPPSLEECIIELEKRIRVINLAP